MNSRELACAALLLAAAAGMPFAAANAAIPPTVMGSGIPSLAPMIRRVSPAVVTISVRGVRPGRGSDDPLRDDPFHDGFFLAPPGQDRDEQPFAAAGSGVIVDSRRGYILTNAHVVDHATGMTVTLEDGRRLQARLVGSDPPSDIAVVQVHARGLTRVPFGDSAKLAVGDYVVAIGNPFGLPDSATAGIVSGLRRSGLDPDHYEDYIQTDASINPGNSGGALVDLRGHLVGINTAILSGSGGNMGIGFSIPVDSARLIMRQLIDHGAVERGQLGVSVFAVTAEMARTLGLRRPAGGLVTQVVPGSPAEKAGVRAGDVITSVAGHPVRSNADLRNAIGFLRVGDEVTVDLLHDARRQQRRAILASSLVRAPAMTPAGAPDGPPSRSRQ